MGQTPICEIKKSTSMPESHFKESQNTGHQPHLFQGLNENILEFSFKRKSVCPLRPLPSTKKIQRK